MDSPFISDWLFDHAARVPESAALGTPTTWLSYGELAARVQAFAGHLVAGGIGPGDRVLLSLPNSVAAVVAGLAVHTVGATSVEVSREWRVDALGDVVARSRPRQAIVSARDARTWAEVVSGKSLERVWLVGGPAADPPARSSSARPAHSSLRMAASDRRPAGRRVCPSSSGQQTRRR